MHHFCYILDTSINKSGISLLTKFNSGSNSTLQPIGHDIDSESLAICDEEDNDNSSDDDVIESSQPEMDISTTFTLNIKVCQ